MTREEAGKTERINFYTFLIDIFPKMKYDRIRNAGREEKNTGNPVESG
jgi:hypothetical protein